MSTGTRTDQDRGNDPDTGRTTVGAAAAKAAVDHQRLAEDHLHLVEHALRGLRARLPRHADLDDLRSAGRLGLVDAATRYDPATGVPFARYAMQRVRGSMLDATRSVDWATRSVRRAMREVERCERQLEQHLGRPATTTEIADDLGITEDEVERRRREATAANVLHLDHPTPGGDGSERTLGDGISDRRPGIDPSDVLENRELLGTVRSALAFLPDVQRDVLERHYFHGELFCDIAADLGVTEPRVSQLRAEAINSLRAYLGGAYEGVPEVPAGAPGVRRRAAYVAEVSSYTTWRSHLEAADLTEAGAWEQLA